LYSTLTLEFPDKRCYQNNRNIAYAFIGGFPKCGTTSLFDWLADHPEVCPASLKETCYFDDPESRGYRKEANYLQHGLEGYERYFRHCANQPYKVRIEATPHYVERKTALEFLPTLQPMPQFIFLLRKPSARIYSSYQFRKNNVTSLDSRVSLQEYSPLNNEPEMYLKSVSRWIDRCGRDHIHVLLFEEMRRDPRVFVREVSRRIGIDQIFWDTYSFVTKNKSIKIRNPALHRAVRRWGRPIARWIPQTLWRVPMDWYLSLNASPADPISEADREHLRKLDETFLPFYEKLEAQLGIDLSIWRS
jgi:hypothetical protein